MIIKEICSLLGDTTRNRVKVIEAFAEEPIWINGEAGNISHALMNLCLNSLDAMPDGGILTLRTAIFEESWVEVSVEDNGEGISPEVLAHVKEPFYTTKEVGKGTGLGLSMTYGVVKAHGGTIEIASQPGQGTTVKLRFPRVPIPVENEAMNAPAPSLGSMTVFLVDDDEDLRCLMTRMLKQAGVRQLKTFPGGKDVLEALHSGEVPDLIILDQNMPGMNGTQTMERIRNRHPEMPILISSGQPGIADWGCFKQPNVGVISKPFTMEEILAKLVQFLAESISGQLPHL
jgi:CheY-like chemotaxis protein